MPLRIGLITDIHHGPDVDVRVGSAAPDPLEKFTCRMRTDFRPEDRYLDATPKGRGENGPYNTLADWVRPKNMYGKGGLVEGSGRYHPLACGCAVHQPAGV
jgi:hypothetical protein